MNEWERSRRTRKVVESNRKIVILLAMERYSMSMCLLWCKCDIEEFAKRALLARSLTYSYILLFSPHIHARHTHEIIDRLVSSVFFSCMANKTANNQQRTFQSGTAGLRTSSPSFCYLFTAQNEYSFIQTTSSRIYCTCCCCCIGMLTFRSL